MVIIVQLLVTFISPQSLTFGKRSVRFTFASENCWIVFLCYSSVLKFGNKQFRFVLILKTSDDGSLVSLFFDICKCHHYSTCPDDRGVSNACVGGAGKGWWGGGGGYALR